MPRKLVDIYFQFHSTEAELTSKFVIIITVTTSVVTNQYNHNNLIDRGGRGNNLCVHKLRSNQSHTGGDIKVESVVTAA